MDGGRCCVSGSLGRCNTVVADSAGDLFRVSAIGKDIIVLSSMCSGWSEAVKVDDFSWGYAKHGKVLPYGTIHKHQG